MSLKSLTGVAALALGVSFFVSMANAQLGNDGGSLNGGQRLTVSAGPSVSASVSEPTGPGVSRLPLTTPDVMPFEATTGTPLPSQIGGTSARPAKGSQAYGSSSEKWPYTMSRVAISGAPGPGSITQWIPVSSKPFRFTGKLWMHFSDGWYVCTASLVKKGVLITAAHCVHNFGQGAAGFADEVRFYPANAGGTGPWGYFSGAQWRVPTPYFNGTDTCQSGAVGIVCNNDIATVTLAPRSGKYAGQYVGGWYNYSWNLWGFVNSPGFGNHWINDISQLGYPVAFDDGRHMQRNNSFGKYVAGTGSNGLLLRNIQLGSAQTGGSSGGPWLTNFGVAPGVDPSEGFLGFYSVPLNVVTAVTSWGYTDPQINVQGASYFGQNYEFSGADYGGYGAGNIGKIMQDTCTAAPAAC